MITSFGFSGGWKPGQILIQGATFDLSAHCFAEIKGGSIIDSTWTHDGVKERSLADLDASWCKRIPADKILTLSQNFQMEMWLRDQIGKPYDPSFLRAPFHPDRDWQEDDRWWCSEVLGGGLVKFGVLVVPKMHRLSPRNLYRRLEAVGGLHVD